jgi:hypothetical protein
MAEKKPAPNRVAQDDPVVETFHSGAHPQRDLPSDMSEEEKEALDRERESLHAPEVADDLPPDLRPSPALPWIDPKRPNRGVLYVGPTAAEEAAMRTGADPETMEKLLEAPAKRLEKARKDQNRRAARRRGRR